MELSTLSCLSIKQKNLLASAQITTVSQLLTQNPATLADKLKLPLDDVQKLYVDAISKEISPIPRRIERPREDKSLLLGDARIDALLGGGIRKGAIWELTGESGSGKSQFALQLSLTAQISRTTGMPDHSTCYITIGAALSTKRLAQLCEHRPTYIDAKDNIHTMSVETAHDLNMALRYSLPSIISHAASTKPVNLLIIDSITPLFRSDRRTTSAALFERSRIMKEISARLRALAREHDLAVLVINQVSDVFGNEDESEELKRDMMIYKNQAKWFGRVPPAQKEASLGLVWANQINARIMLDNTRQRLRARHDMDGLAPSSKRRRMGGPGGGLITTSTASNANAAPPPGPVEYEEEESQTSIRKLSVVFSSFSQPGSLDFIVTASGLRSISDSQSPPLQPPAPSSATSDVDGPLHVDQEGKDGEGGKTSREMTSEEWDAYFEAYESSEVHNFDLLLYDVQGEVGAGGFGGAG